MTSLCHRCVHNSVCEQYNADRDMVRKICDYFYSQFMDQANTAIVVRCRECKRWDVDPDSYGKDDGPKGKCMKSFEETYDDDFCSYGQKRC